MKKLLLPVTLVGWWLLLLGIGGLTAHYYLLAYPKYTAVTQAVVILLSLANVLLGLLFIFIRRILLLALQLVLYFVMKRMAGAAAETMRRFAAQLNDIKTSLDQ